MFVHIKFCQFSDLKVNNFCLNVLFRCNFNKKNTEKLQTLVTSTEIYAQAATLLIKFLIRITHFDTITLVTMCLTFLKSCAMWHG